MKIGIISIGGKSSKLVAEECRKYFDKVEELDLRKFDIRLINDETKVTFKGEGLLGFDCFYVRGSHRYAFLQQAITKQFYRDVYMPISHKAFMTGHDKFLTSLLLKEQGVSVPKTYYAANSDTAKRIVEEVVSYPIILKAQAGTHGKGVLIAENPQTAKGILDILETFKQPFIIQEFVETENTSDIRVIVSGKKVMASYLRVACDGEFRANVHAGGTRQEHKLTKEQEKLAVRSAKTLGADICGVDILNSKEPSVIEINLSPSLYSVHEVTGVNAIWEVAKELYNQTIKFQAKKDDKLRKKLEKKAKKLEKSDLKGLEDEDLGEEKMFKDVVSSVVQGEEASLKKNGDVESLEADESEEEVALPLVMRGDVIMKSIDKEKD
jgi:ribosomal protein S6--L-glutamate ligase